MGKFFKDLKSGLEDVVAYKKGKLTLRSEIIEIPEPQLNIGPRTLETSKHQRKRKLSLLSNKNALRLFRSIKTERA